MCLFLIAGIRKTGAGAKVHLYMKRCKNLDQRGQVPDVHPIELIFQ